MRLAIAMVVFNVGCRQLFGIGDPTPNDAMRDTLSVDVKTDAPGRDCLPAWRNGTVQLAAPVPLNVNMVGSLDRDPFLSADELKIVWSSDRSGGLGGADVWTAKRPSIGDPFDTIIDAVNLSSPQEDSRTTFTNDELYVIVASSRPGGQGTLSDLWQATRASAVDAFPALDQQHLQNLNGPAADLDPEISSDGLRLYYAPVGIAQEIMMTSRASRSDDWPTPVQLPDLDTGNSNADPALSADESVMVFSGVRANGVGLSDIWYAAQTAPNTFTAPMLVPTVNTVMSDGDPWLSPDGCRLYMSSNRSGDYELYMASVP